MRVSEALHVPSYSRTVDCFPKEDRFFVQSCCLDLPGKGATMPEEPKLQAGEALGGPAAQPTQFPTDVAGLSTVYTNFCRVSVTPEELVLDFGLNTSVMPNATEPIK